MLARLVTGPVHRGLGRRLPAGGASPIAILGLALAPRPMRGAGLAEGVWLQGALLVRRRRRPMAGLIPLTDVLSLQVARRHGFDFAWPRGCGSAAFVAANIVMGALLLTRASVDCGHRLDRHGRRADRPDGARPCCRSEPVTEGPKIAGRERFARPRPTDRSIRSS